MTPQVLANLMFSKIPKPKNLTMMLNEIVYVKPFSEVNKDILRLIRRVSISKKKTNHQTQTREEEIIRLSVIDLPKEVKETEKETVYLTMILMQNLVQFFEPKEKAKKSIKSMEDIYQTWVRQTRSSATAAASADGEELREEVVDGGGAGDMEFEDYFTVLNLVEAIGGDRSETALGLRCIHQSVAISGHMHIKSTVCPFMTKDVRGETGWQVVLTLAEYVQVKHTRREGSVESSSDRRNHWEMEYDVHLTFDKNMSEITRTKLTITDLELSDTMDGELSKYLKEKLSDGDLVVC